MKRWWVKGLLGAGVWLGLMLGAGILHTSTARLSEAEDAAVSERYGMLGGAGMVAALLLAYARRKRGA